MNEREGKGREGKGGEGGEGRAGEKRKRREPGEGLEARRGR